MRVPPYSFIPSAEESGLIVPIGRWVLAEVVRQWTGRRPMRGGEPLGLTVNVSGAQLDEGLAGLGEDLAAAATALPGRLSIEITESHLAVDPERAATTLERLRRLGVGVIVDDFGTGYSSLQYLRDFPVNALKIDRSFVEHVHEDARDQAIVATVIGLAHTLGILAIAEGVESEAQLGALRALSCDWAQGFHLAPPEPFELVRARLNG